MKSLAFVAVVALVTLLLIGALLAVRTSQQSAALASPTATRTVAPVPTASPSVQPTPFPSPTPSVPARSPEELADRLADALEASDVERLRSLMDPAGFFYQLYQTDGSQPITPDQAIDRIRRGTADGTLHVTVQRRPLLPRGQFQPDGDRYMASTWLRYDNRPTQRVDLMLKNESGRWYWRAGSSVRRRSSGEGSSRYALAPLSQTLKARRSPGRPRKSFTRSAAGFVPPGARTWSR